MNMRIMWCFLLLIIFSGPLLISAKNDLDLQHFQKLMILEEGRLKPMDTYAENVLKTISGKRKYRGNRAIDWFAQVVFEPQKSQKDSVFLISHPDVCHAIGLAAKEKRGRYSFSQLGPHLRNLESLAYSAAKIKNEERTVIETGIIRLYNNVYLYNQLANSLLFLAPREEFSHFIPGSSSVSLLQILSNKYHLSDDERKNILDWFNRFGDSPLKIICNKTHPDKWESPWQSLMQSFRMDRPLAGELFVLSSISSAYIRGDQEAFDNGLKRFIRSSHKKWGDNRIEKKITREVLYNQLNAFYRARFFYGFALVFLMFSFLLKGNWPVRVSIGLLGGGFILQSLGIVLRMMIRSRPPVTNLYETFIFAAWMSVLIGIVLIFFKKRDVGILTGGMAGLILLMISGKYELEGDTMGMLMAVLDSNFWLATHVITITVGYAGMVISGIIGHLYVFQKFFSPQKKDILRGTFQSIYATQAFALVFTFVGTVLGGMWADQSWGRFWGWDPKENGALVIILWSAILFHSRLSGIVGELGFSLGAIGSIIAVALAWFGVNLLGVGLHSYGFTSGVALALAVFVCCEMVFICVSYLLFKFRKS